MIRHRYRGCQRLVCVISYRIVTQLLQIHRDPLFQFLDVARVLLGLAEARTYTIQFRGYDPLLVGAQRARGLAEGAPAVTGRMRSPGPSGEEIVIDRLRSLDRALVIPAALQGRPEDAQRASRCHDKEVAIGQLDPAGADSIPIPPTLENLTVPRGLRLGRRSLLYLRCHRPFEIFVTVES